MDCLFCSESLGQDQAVASKLEEGVLNHKDAESFKMSFAIRKSRIVNCFRRWILMLKMDPDFQQDSTFIAISQLVSKLNQIPTEKSIVRNVVIDCGLDPSQPLSQPAPPPEAHLKLRKGKKEANNITDIDVDEVAKHITAENFRVLGKIKSSEIMCTRWLKPEKSTLSPNLLKFVDSFNRMSHWVATEIILAEDPTEAIQYFIKLCQSFLALHNFHGIFIPFF
jgi:hypothetical protein